MKLQYIKALLPNFLTGIRFILTTMFICLLARHLIQGSPRMPSGLYIIFIFICLSDFFDGAAARRLKAESALGGILDVLADCLFIFSSLAVLNFFRVLPLWFTAVVLVDFLVFLGTSHFLTQIKMPAPRKPFVFDMTGRIAAILFYSIPAAACAAYGHPTCIGLLDAILCIAVFLAVISMAWRCASCFAACHSVRNL